MYRDRLLAWIEDPVFGDASASVFDWLDLQISPPTGGTFTNHFQNQIRTFAVGGLRNSVAT